MDFLDDITTHRPNHDRFTRRATDPQTTPRKRRRRKVVGSNSLDACFTCAARRAACDRCRPYCSQCLELGWRCSGYKTTLTWGLGVASRGKLRGLSMPVSDAQRASVSPKQQNSAVSTTGPTTYSANEQGNDAPPGTQCDSQISLESVKTITEGKTSSPSSYLEAVADDKRSVRSEGDGDDRKKTCQRTVDNSFYEFTFRYGGFPYIPQPTYSSVGKTRRMSYLIGYYSEVIAPVMVTFENPTNPYRAVILELARGSDMLQHAIAALSLSNLRQRRNRALSTGKTIQSRKSCQAHCRMTEQSFEEFGPVSLDGQMKEETLHKANAINLVNRHLGNPVRWYNDDLLATLLVLCLFYMCETGVASFRTHFAGVKKLLDLRDGRRSQAESHVARWITRMYTWFDTLTASVNDRDNQLNGRYLDITTAGNEEWTLENIAGCDSGLFRIVAQLGRLNQLSQGKNVTLADDMNPLVPAVAVPPPPPPLHQIYPSNPCAIPADKRTDFWREWHAIRQQLESWRLNVSCASDFSATNVADLSNISESFRYSALLYLERLAHPDTPSSHSRIRSLVYAALQYITAVQSDVFLLWPLFVTGAECTLESDRVAIRERCADIQKNSGFVNNLSCLQLMERIWARDDHNNVEALSSRCGSEEGTEEQSVLGGKAFGWRKVLDAERSDTEYIVV